MYHYINVEFVMRDCDSVDDAIKNCEAMLPQHPDENTTYIESWRLARVMEGLPNHLYKTSKENLS